MAANANSQATGATAVTCGRNQKLKHPTSGRVSASEPDMPWDAANLKECEACNLGACEPTVRDFNK